MKKFALALFVSTFAMVPAIQPVLAATVKVSPRDIIYDAQGARLGDVIALTSKGSPQVSIGSRIVTVPLSTLSETGGKLTTSLTREQIVAKKK